ncbi:MAG: amino acid adenylation domain-containing protein [Chloroflexota bacterium]
MAAQDHSPLTLTREILQQLAASEHPRLVQAYLQAQLARLLRHPVAPGDLHRSLIALGLDSFMSGELSYGIESDLGVVIPLADFFGDISPAALAQRIVDEAAAPLESAAPVPLPAAGEFPLSFGQQALWALYQMAPEEAAYNLAYAMRLRCELDVAALQQVWRTLVRRHTSLRTTFSLRQGEPVQHVHADAAPFFQHEDLAGCSEDTLRLRLADEANQPFDLEQGPLFRLHLFTCSAQEHVLLLVCHHIVIDFWSVAALLHEMGALYAAEKEAAFPAELQSSRSYTDYVAWQTGLLAGPRGEQLWSYWQQQLSGELPDLGLVTDYPRPPVQTYAGAAQPCQLDRDVTRRLKAFSQSRGVTLYATLLAAFQVLLHRYSGQDQILVGTPISGRTQADFFDVAGYFVNSVVMRARFDENPSFVDFLRQVHRSEVEALQHQDYPFSALVRRLQPERDFSRSPLFQAMFVYQQPRVAGEESIVALDLGLDGVPVNVPGLPFETLAVARQSAQFDLTLAAGEVDGQLAVLLKYNTDLFAPETIERLLVHWRALLDSILADPEQRVSALPILASGERQQLLEAWNETQADFVTPLDTLPAWFEDVARHVPAATAVVFEGRTWTYQTLNRQANRLAHHLQALGVGPEVRVGVCLERSFETVVALLGVLKAGGVYVPLDPSYPAERLAFMQADARLAVLLTVSSLAQAIPQGAARLVCLDAVADVLTGQSDAAPSPALNPENLAYVIYTSGSSGTPKGVMVPHRAICNHLRWRAVASPLGGEDRFLQLASASFDVSLWEILAPLLGGAQLVLPPHGGEKDLRGLVRLIDERQVTHLRMGPALLNVFLEHADAAGCPSLRGVFCGGESLSLDLQERFFASFPGVALYNQYGPTETCVAATMWACVRDDERLHVPIGRPVANMRTYVLDAHLQPVPVGVIGELFIAGQGLARGYLDRPKLTAERFIPDPFGNQPGARLYKTGDRVRYLPDGNLEFLGRSDRQVKIRGFRVEPGEVEAALSRHPALAAAAVEAQPERTPLFGETVNDQLVAYLVARSPEPPSLGDLRSFLKHKLPDYLIPAAFVFLETLPLTPNGKLDRKALPALDVNRPALDGAYEAPRTPVEEVLAEMWAELLEIDRVGIHDSFFELGGHSLLAVQSMATLQDLFAIEEPLIILFFENPTVAGLAEVLTESLGGDAETIAQKLRMVMEMSDEDVENMLLDLGSNA